MFETMKGAFRRERGWGQIMKDERLWNTNMGKGESSTEVELPRNLAGQNEECSEPKIRRNSRGRKKNFTR